MRRIVDDQTTLSGLDALLGERVTLLCLNYFYTGKLSGVNETCVLLTDNPAIVYESGPWSEKKWTDAQTLPTQALYVQRSAIEAFGVLK
mgnify:CR=1 FL=1